MISAEHTRPEPKSAIEIQIQDLKDKVEFYSGQNQRIAFHAASHLMPDGFPTESFKTPPFNYSPVSADTFGEASFAAVMHFRAKKQPDVDDETLLPKKVTELYDSERFEGIDIVVVPDDQTQKGLDTVGENLDGSPVFGRMVEHLPLRFPQQPLANLHDEVVRLENEHGYVQGVRRMVKEVYDAVYKKYE